MKASILALILCLTMCLAGTSGLAADAVSTQPVVPIGIHSSPLESVLELQDLATIVDNIPTISRETLLRRRVAQATFCLPQNILGTMLYGLLQLSGTVVNTAEMNEMTIIVTTKPIGVSLGKFIFLPESYLVERYVRHEYGHTLQGYKHGPFFLLFEGVVSFVQAAISLISPSFAEGYYERWPENEASRLGGIL